jgi:hypothetical protein
MIPLDDPLHPAYKSEAFSHCHGTYTTVRHSTYTTVWHGICTTFRHVYDSQRGTCTTGSHEYFDNLCRFSLLCWAAIEAPLMLPPDDPFGEEVVFIANDW